jgi:hypothetical protein
MDQVQIPEKAILLIGGLSETLREDAVSQGIAPFYTKPYILSL